MHRETLPIGNLATWARLNNVEFNGVEVCSLPDSRGSRVLVITDCLQEDAVLMRIPQELILSLENVWIYAKSDRHLTQLLEAAGEFTRTARGAILTFLLLQLTNGATRGKIGVLNPFSEYVKFLPLQVPIPTFWNDEERLLLTGTTLQAALDSKLQSLDHEFTTLREKTVSIDWCQEHWWDEETGTLTFEDWKQVDAMYRSRALDLPSTGHCMVPCIDMSNHASGDQTTALYDTDINGDATLVLRGEQRLKPNEEVTITYGDEKGACEMLFSYGFIESNMTSARELFLDLEIPDDDPLKLAKKAVSKSAPGFRLFEDGESIGWEGPFVWLIVINEEDGLEFKILQNANGDKELQASWKSKVVPDMTNLQTHVESEDLWDVFKLRAVSILQERVEKQLYKLEGSAKYLGEHLTDEYIESNVKYNAGKLRQMEEALLMHAYDQFELKKIQLVGSPIVQKYLSMQAARNEPTSDDDFS